VELFNSAAFTFYFTILFEKLQDSGMPIASKYKSGARIQLLRCGALK